MLDGEEETYKHLPDRASREQFIAEFWKKRDPDPTTEENEFKLEFAERIEEANELFGYGFGRRGMNTGRGWNSDQGRVYLILGPPDRLRHYMREVDPAMRTTVVDPQRGVVTEHVQIEEWFYEKYSSPIEFERADRGWHLGTQTPAVLSILQEAKEALIAPEYAASLRHGISLQAVYEEGEILIEIPPERLNYKEAGEFLFAAVRISVEVTFEGEKLEEFTRTQEFKLTETELLAQPSFTISIPYTPQARGSYIFELVVEDKMSMTVSRYRCRVEYKHTP
jgi:GWxTD domain-containing protein